MRRMMRLVSGSDMLSARARASSARSSSGSSKNDKSGMALRVDEHKSRQETTGLRPERAGQDCYSNAYWWPKFQGQIQETTTGDDEGTPTAVTGKKGTGALPIPLKVGRKRSIAGGLRWAPPT